MNYLTQINDPIINNAENTLRKVVKRTPRTYFGPPTVYSNKFAFDIPREHNMLSQIFIKVSATTAGDNETPAAYAGCWHFKRIQVRSKNGKVIATNTPSYISARCDELTGTAVNSLLLNAMTQEPTTWTGTTTATFIVPFFAFFGESPEAALQTMHMEELEVYCEVADNKGAMGLPADITAASYEIYYVYHDPVERVPLKAGIVSAYDIFEEQPVQNTGTNAYTEACMSCPYPVFAVHSSMRDLAQQGSTITNLNYKVAGNELIDTDTRILFSLFTNGSSTPNDVAIETSSTSPYYFSRERGSAARLKTKDFIKFTGSMYPCILRASHSNDNTKYLYNVCEYRYFLEITDKGKIVKHFSDSLIFNKA